MNPKNYPRFIPWDLLLQPQAPKEDTSMTTLREFAGYVKEAREYLEKL